MRKTIIILSALLVCCLVVGTVSAYDQPAQDAQGNYLLGTVSNLQWFSEQINLGNTGYNAKLINNISLNGISFDAIGTDTSSYNGVFDGNGYIISDLSGADKSLFNVVSGGTIKNLMLLNFAVTSSTTYGCLIKSVKGTASFTMDSCAIVSSTLTSSGNDEFRGMLIGLITSTGTIRISNCYADSCTHNVGQYIRCSGLLFGGDNSNIENHVYWNNCYVYNCNLLNSNPYSKGLHAFIVGQSTGWNKIQYTYSLVVIGGSINMNTNSLFYSSPDTGLIVGYSSAIENTHAGGLYYSNDVSISNKPTNFDTYATSSKSNGQIKTLSDIQASNGVFFTTASNWDSLYQWDFANTWYWDDTANLPKLQVFNINYPIIHSITNPANPSPINTAIISTVSASPAIVGNTLTYKWQVSTNNGVSWVDVSGQTSQTMSYTPSMIGAHQFRVIVTEVQTTLTATSSIVSSLIVEAPVIDNIGISLSKGKLQIAYSPTITFSITNLGGSSAVYYKLQSSIDGLEYIDTGNVGTTTSIGIKSFSVSINDNVESTHYYRVLATSINGSYVSPILAISNIVNFQTYAPPNVVSTSIILNPNTIRKEHASTISISALNTPISPLGNPYTYNWYYSISASKTSSDALIGSWPNINQPYSWSIPSTLFTTEGSRYVYLQIEDSVGNVVSTNTAILTIVEGALPTVTITAPQNGQQFKTKGQITVTATATGEGNTYLWDFGDSTAEHGSTTSLNTWVQYKYSGDKIIRITATNEYGSVSSQIYINYYDPTTRPMATATIAPVPTTVISNLTNVVDVNPGEYPSIKDTVSAIMSPIEEVMPTGFVFVLVFGVIFLMLWLITKNTAVPAIIGLIFGAFILALFPASYYGPAIVILAISIAGGVYRVFRPPQ